jgi:hypothetical protein
MARLAEVPHRGLGRAGVTCASVVLVAGQCCCANINVCPAALVGVWMLGLAYQGVGRLHSVGLA